MTKQTENKIKVEKTPFDEMEKTWTFLGTTTDKTMLPEIKRDYESEGWAIAFTQGDGNWLYWGKKNGTVSANA